MKVFKKIRVFLLSVCMLVALIPNEAFAASARVSVSSVSGNVGSTVTITCTATMSGASIGAADIVLEYDASALGNAVGSAGANANAGSVVYSGSVSGDGQNSLSFTVSFQIKKEGTHSVRVTDAHIWGYSGDELVPSIGNGTVTGKAVTSNNPGGNSGNTTSGNSGNNGTTQDNKDTNNKLKSLQVSPGSLSPAFSANTTSYKVNVPEGTTEMIVSAAAQSSKANVSVSGNKNLQPGENTAKVVVTSESGATRVYTLTVICGEATTNEEPQEEPEKIQINGTDNTINEAFTDDTIPVGFVRDKITYNGKQYEALKHEKGELMLVNLQNETGNVFYIFNSETQEFYNFVQISFSEGRYIIPLTLDDTKEFADYETTVVTLQDKPFDAWKVDEEYSIIRVMNSEGEIVLYQYDSLDGTIQRYAGAVAKETVEEVEETEETFLSLLEKYHLYVIAGLGGLALVLMITLIYFIATRKHRHQARKRKMQKKLEKQREE